MLLPGLAVDEDAPAQLWIALFDRLEAALVGMVGCKEPQDAGSVVDLLAWYIDADAQQHAFGKLDILDAADVPGGISIAPCDAEHVALQTHWRGKLALAEIDFEETCSAKRSVKPVVENTSWCHFANGDGDKCTHAQRDEAKLRSYLLAAQQHDRDACASLVHVLDGPNAAMASVPAAWQVSVLAKHVDKVLPMLRIMLHVQAPVVLKQLQRSFEAIRAGGELRNHVALRTMWLKIVSTLNESMFSGTKGPEGMAGKPNSCPDVVCAPISAWYYNAIAVSKAMGAAARAAVLAVAREVRGMQHCNAMNLC